MKIADQLTHNKEEFSLYLTDVNGNNFVVDASGKVTIVDAEDIVVVDTRAVRAGKTVRSFGIIIWVNPSNAQVLLGEYLTFARVPPSSHAEYAILISVFQTRRGNRDKFVVVLLLFYVHSKHLRSCRDCQLP